MKASDIKALRANKAARRAWLVEARYVADGRGAAGLLHQLMKLPNRLVGQVGCRIDMVEIRRYFVSPEYVAFDVVSRLLQVIHALQHLGRGVTKNVHLLHVVPERLGYLGRMNLPSLVRAERFGNGPSTGDQPVSQDFHFLQNEKGEAPRRVSIFRNLCITLDLPLVRGNLVCGVNCACRKDRLSPRCSRCPPGEGLANQFERGTVNSVCNVDFYHGHSLAWAELKA